MDNLKNQIIDKIISLLSPLRNTYPEEINIITNDLINYKFDSLIEFVNNHFNNLNVSNEIREFVNKLIESKLIDESFNNKVKKQNIHEFIPFKESNILLVSSRPLNVKENILNQIKLNSPTPELIKINHEYTEVKFQDKEESDDNQVNIDDLRKKILDAQLSYISDATNFIKKLETKDEIELYQCLIDLNDIRFIQHSLSKLSKSALIRLLPYVEEKLENNKHSSIDMFIIDVIKKNLHTKMH